jgi:O-acetyl-ADP-ribose deacetylase (regulator of RNase III)
MLKYVEGDLVMDAEQFELIGHCCNCFCTMGSGIAPLIKTKFPEAYEVDCETRKGDKLKLGSISHTVGTTPIVVNIYGQYGYWGRNEGKMDLDYDALRSGFKYIKEKFSGKRMGFPMLGSGLAGGDWGMIESIIIEELEGEDVTIVKFNPLKR